MSQVKKKLGRGLALLLAVLQVMLVFAVVPVSAADDPVASGNCGNETNDANLTWTLDSAGTLTISKVNEAGGGMKSYQQDSESGDIAPWRNLTVPVKNIVIEDGVTTIGQYAFYGCDALESVSLPESMLSFNNYAFQNCTSLESITIPDNVWSIGQAALSGCTALTSVTISNASNLQSIADNTFEGCTNLTSVTIPSSVTSIEERAFYGCKALTGITIPASVTSIESYAFYGCSSSMGVTYTGTKAQWKGITVSANNDSLTNATITCTDGTITMIHTLSGTISENGYFYDPTVSGNKTQTYSKSAIEGSSVQYCVYADADKDYVLAELTVDNQSIPAAVNESKYLGTYTMGDHDATIVASFKPRPDEGTCGDNLKWKLEDGTLTISGTGTMKYYTVAEPAPWHRKSAQIEKVVMEDGITSIGDYAFADCSSLTDVTIPNGVVYIGYYAFASCKSLTSVTLPDGITTIGGYAFDYCSSLKTVNIPETVTRIEQAAFRGCTSLTSITIPASVTKIGNAPFAGASCTFTVAEGNPNYCAENGALFNKDKTILYGYYGEQTEYVIPDTVTTIDRNAFSYCSKLTSVTIPAGVTTIKNGTFYECTKLTSVTIPASVESIEQVAFRTYNSLKAVTYAGTKAQWKEITIASGNDDLKNATITCTDGIIDATRHTLSGKIDDFGYFASASNEHSSTYEESAKEGDNVWYCVYADDGYVLQQLEVGSELKSIGQTFYSGYYVMGAENATITAKFRPESDDGFKIDYNSDLKNGTISVDGTLVEAGETVTVTVKPNPGYKLASLTGNYQVKGETLETDLTEVGNGVYTFTMPARNVHLNASFEIDQEHHFGVYEVVPNVDIDPSVEGISDADVANAQVTGIGGAVDVNDILENSGLEDTTEMVLSANILVTEADLEAQTVSFEVKPVATVLDLSTASGIAVEITNDMLNGNPITVKLPIPAGMADLQEIVHISEDGTEEYYTPGGKNQFTIEEDPWGQKFAVLQVTHFSTFKMNGTAHTHKTELQNAKDATCTKDGYTGDEVCKTCGETITKGKTIEKLGHKTELKDAKEATCTEDGYTGDKVCTVCKETIEQGQTIAKLGHKTELKNAKDATCTKDGYTGDKVCTVCGKTVEDGKAIPAKGHSWDDGEVTQKPTLTKEGVKTYTCTVCADTKTERIEKLTTCDGGEDCPTHNYKDVKFSQWYHLDVDYVVESGLMVGDGSGIFRPDDKLSRAEMVQILYNWAGKPEVTGSSKFSDVADSAWYAKPVIWATGNGIVNGVGDGKFAPNDPVTREQLVAMLYRYAEKPEVSNELTDFADANKISDYAVSAVKWAVEQDILRGDGSPRKLRPTDHAKRCEVAAMLHRYIG